MTMRTDGRLPNQLRTISIETGIAPHAGGSVLIGFGNTRVICAANIEDGVPRWMKDQKVSGGWLTAEYSMLPYSTLSRKARDISRGKMDGRGTEIQRLIGRSLRAVVDLEALGPRTLWVDCDVLQADGGTRTASITGACIAVELAAQKLIEEKKLTASPLKDYLAAVSVGVVGSEVFLDLEYVEDRDAEVDLNLVMTGAGEFVEIQASGEEATFSSEQLSKMLEFGRAGIEELIAKQKAVSGGI
ncbi:MAG: ribonuclease PH [Chthoniobacterales bacterium]